MGSCLGEGSRETAQLVVSRPAAGIDAAEQIVQAQVAQQPLEGGGDGLQGNGAGLGNATGQDGVGAYVGAQIEEDITRPELVEHEGHIRGLMRLRSCQRRKRATVPGRSWLARGWRCQ